MDQYSKILTAYRQHKSLDISYQTVRRVLVTAGLYTSPPRGAHPRAVRRRLLALISARG